MNLGRSETRVEGGTITSGEDKAQDRAEGVDGKGDMQENVGGDEMIKEMCRQRIR